MIECSTVIAHPRRDLFTWHTRPGAVRRLLPPWQPLTVVSEAESLVDGRAVLRLPGGLKWVAQHDPSAFVADSCFVDALATGGWRHIHEFSDAGTDRTQVRDRVETPVPARILQSMFTYRHRQLADDLAAHHFAAESGLSPRVVAITGTSGLVGSALAAFLTTGGHRVIRLVRRLARDRDERHWEPMNPAPDLLRGVDAVIHLAGASIAGRFTTEHKQRVRDSRIEPTRRLALAAAHCDGGPSVFISASAIGFYGPDRGDAILSEDSSRGEGFLADVVAKWEDATTPADEAGIRVVRVRTGIVQAAAGGSLRLLRPLFSVGLGGKLGSGQQWVSWIGLDDLVDVYHRAIWDSDLNGPVNAVAPQAVRNDEYTDTLGTVLNRPTVLPVPSFAPRLLLGSEGTRELAQADQRVAPGRLLDRGHRFRQPNLADALAHQLGRFSH
ncbi:MAG TPA: TIGR01777 family oxidoreductase [Mycobacterium sp.]|nr:TIGR01777 family oxidoreductase [Mycobacterium sp.]